MYSAPIKSGSTLSVNVPFGTAGFIAMMSCRGQKNHERSTFEHACSWFITRNEAE